MTLDSYLWDQFACLWMDEVLLVVSQSSNILSLGFILTLCLSQAHEMQTCTWDLQPLFMSDLFQLNNGEMEGCFLSCGLRENHTTC
jgi:hypothetical protein